MHRNSIVPISIILRKLFLISKWNIKSRYWNFGQKTKNLQHLPLSNLQRESIRLKRFKIFFAELIEEYKSANRLGNAKVYKDTLATLNSFRNNNLDILFLDIDTSWLIQFEKWFLDRGYTETSASLQFRTLHSVFNKAIERKIVRKDIYPFDTFKISKFSTKTKKRAISKNEIKIILHLDLSKESKLIQLSRDIFTSHSLNKCG